MPLLEKQNIIVNAGRLIVALHITGDAAGDFVSYTALSLAEYEASSLCFVGYNSNISGFSARLFWGGVDTKPFFSFPDGETFGSLEVYGGLRSYITVPDGTIRLTTFGLEAGDHGTIILEFQKRG